MTYSASTAYACVAYRIMKYEGDNQSEETMEMLMGVLHDFFTEKEIERIYRKDIIFDSYDTVINDENIKQITE